MRGKPDIALGRRIRVRITPAHAGKTMWSSAAASSNPDHPRACGENIIDFAKEIVIDWITPAHAGKTYDPAVVVDGLADHPRACGENSDFRDLSD